MKRKAPDMHSSWLEVLSSEFNAPYMQRLRDFLITEKAKSKVIYPPNKKTFSCLNLSPLDSTKVVIIGQDPYHGDGQANGLAFAVEQGIEIPPSLKNIYKEIELDLGNLSPNHGDLSFLAKQGVVLLNSVLTVEKGSPGSHSGKGWEKFTDKIISILNTKDDLVFMLWGSYAQKKGSIIDSKKHRVLKASHPSPLSAYRGFFGCKHFSKANEFLITKGKSPIVWTSKRSID